MKGTGPVRMLKGPTSTRVQPPVSGVDRGGGQAWQAQNLNSGLETSRRIHGCDYGGVGNNSTGYLRY
jgi:outer membrane cobalamin receptor